MPPAAKDSRGFVLAGVLLAAYATNNRINRYLIENLSDDDWRAEPPGGKGRTIAGIVAHVHNVRVMWLKAAAKGTTIRQRLDRHSVWRPRPWRVWPRAMTPLPASSPPRLSVMGASRDSARTPPASSAT